VIKKSRFVLALAAVIALAFAGIAVGDGTSENDAQVVGSIKGKKFDKKKYKPVQFFAGVATQHQGGVTGTQPNPASEVISFGKNVKFNLGATPSCDGTPPSGSTPDQAKAACPDSFLGSGAAEVTPPGGGAPINDIIVSLFHGGPGNARPAHARAGKANAIILHTYSPTLGQAAPSVNGEVVKSPDGNKYGDALVVKNAPDTGALMITQFNTNVDKKNKSVLARCKSKKFLWLRTVTYTDGTTDQAELSQKCKQKKPKKHNKHH
jgi:hypothetical protein